MTLPAPPWWEHWLLEQPWPLLTTLLGVGAVLLWVAWQRRRKGLGWVAMGCVFLALVIWLASEQVHTAREQMVQAVRATLALTLEQPLSVEKLHGQFTAQAVLAGPQGEVWVEAEGLRQSIERQLQALQLQSHWVRELQAHQRSNQQGQVLLGVTTFFRSEMGEHRLYTRWLFTLQKTEAGDWRIKQLRWLELGDAPARRHVLR